MLGWYTCSLSDNFDRNQYKESIDLPLTCHQSPSLTTFACRSSEVRRLLLDLDHYDGIDPLGMFPLFLKKTALSSRHNLLFQWLLRLDSFPP